MLFELWPRVRGIRETRHRSWMIGVSLQWGLRWCGYAAQETRPGQQRLDARIAARYVVSGFGSSTVMLLLHRYSRYFNLIRWLFFLPFHPHITEAFFSEKSLPAIVLW